MDCQSWYIALNYQLERMRENRQGSVPNPWLSMEDRSWVYNWIQSPMLDGE